MRISDWSSDVCSSDLDCWLRGTACLRRGTYESHAEAQRFFERALEIDPQFARAYAGLSLTHFNEWSCLAWDRWAEKESKARSEERRVGKECGSTCRSVWSRYH